MKTGAITILILLMTGGALAVANKACKRGDHPWCARSLHSQIWQSARWGRTAAREQTANHVGRISSGFGHARRSEVVGQASAQSPSAGLSPFHAATHRCDLLRYALRRDDAALCQDRDAVAQI
jgi:hypothetical protein